MFNLDKIEGGRCKISCTQDFANELFTCMKIAPPFVSLFFGEPDYGCPGSFTHYNEDASLRAIGMTNPHK
jgi:hypothetical protein